MNQTPLADAPALVLGAGFGTRLRPLTDTIPKPAIPVLGRPLLGHPLIHLYAAGCQEVWVNAHHRTEHLQAVIEPWVQRRLLRLRLRWSDEQPRILGTGGALRRLERVLSGRGPILLLNGDSILGADLPRLWAAHDRHRREGAVATLLCVPSPDADRYGAVRVDAQGRVHDLAGLARRPGDPETTACIFAGVHVLEPSVLDRLPPDGEESCIVRQGYAPLLRDGADIRAVVAAPDTLFHDLGTPDRYLDAQAALLRAPAGALPVADGVDPFEALFQEASYAVDAAGREYGSPDAVDGLAGATLRPPFFFGPRNQVERGAVIGPNASIGALNTVRAGARVEDAAVWSGVEVAGVVRGQIVAQLGGAAQRVERSH